MVIEAVRLITAPTIGDVGSAWLIDGSRARTSCTAARPAGRGGGAARAGSCAAAPGSS